MTYEDLRILQLNLSDLHDTLTRIYTEVDECKSSGKPSDKSSFFLDYNPITPEFNSIREDLGALKNRVKRHKLLIDQIIDLIKDERTKGVKSI